ncbi:hypothetical protein ACHAQH_000438 [Verticillium albo-atrum]
MTVKVSRVMEMDSSRSQPYQLPGQDVLADMRLISSVADNPVRGIPKPWNIMKFYDAGVHDSPWVPRGIIITDNQTGQNRDQDSPTASRDSFAPRYREWRSSGPSECDTLPPGHLPSDSGYESRPTKQSIANPSVYGDVDRGHETQSLTGRMDEFDPFAGMSSAPSCTGDPANNHVYLIHTTSSSTFRLQSDAAGTAIICPDCRSCLRTKSELK